MRKLMTGGKRKIVLRHVIVIICFYCKRRIDAGQVLVGQYLGNRQSLWKRIISIQFIIKRTDLFHSIFGIPGNHLLSHKRSTVFGTGNFRGKLV